jgi:hypothetical protein
MNAITGIAAGCLLATVLLPADPPACVNGTLASYIALGAGGCTLDRNTFANFTYSARASGGAAMITADQIQVTPLFIAPETAQFNYSGPWKAGTGQTQDSIISYTVALPSGNTTTEQLNLILGSAHVAANGGVTIRELTTVGHLSVSNRKTADSITFSPVSMLKITDHVSLSAASLSGFDSSLNRCFPCP